jgi:ABC-type branched-subunit amino acid transport system permease subunit
VQQIVYGVILVVVMIFMPGGLDDLLTRLSHRRRLGRRGAVEE